MIDYKLIFDSEQQAGDVINQAVKDLHPREFVLYTIGVHKIDVYDEANPNAPPTVTILSDGWHVDLRLREGNTDLDKYRVYPDTPSHEFS